MIFIVAAFVLPPHDAVIQLCAHPAATDEHAFEDEIASKLRARHIDAALDEARLALQQNPNSSELNQLLGVALFKKGLNQDARTAFQRVIQLDPTRPQSYYNLALVDLSENRYADAITPLETYLRLNPDNAEAHLFLGRAYHNLNRTATAIDQFKKAIALTPKPVSYTHLTLPTICSV